MNFFKYFYNLFWEARSAFRFKQQKQTVLQTLEKYKDDPEVMVSFRDKVVWTSSKKRDYNKEFDVGIGINPNNKYNTPTGIYGYVLKPMWNKFNDKNIPFASDRPTIVVFKLKLAEGEKIAKSSSFTPEQYDEAEGKLKKMYNLTQDDINTLLDQVNSVYINTPFKKFWTLTRQISIDQTKQNGRKHIHYWSTLFIKLGYPIIMDDAGTGTIHSNEPIQSVVFGKKYTEILEIIENKNWDKIEPNDSLQIFINKIIDSLSSQSNLGEWNEKINKMDVNTKKTIFHSIIKNNLLHKLSEKDVEVFKPEQLLTGEYDYNTVLNNIYNVSINKYLVEYLFHHLGTNKVSEFLCIYIGVTNFNISEDMAKSLFKSCLSDLTIKNFLMVFKYLKKIAEKSPNTIKPLLFHTLQKVSNLQQQFDVSSIMKEVVSILLYCFKRGDVFQKDDSFWESLYKNIHDTDELSRQLATSFYNAINSDNVYTNIKDFLPKPILNHLIKHLNIDDGSFLYNTRQILFFIHNLDLVKFLDLQKKLSLFVTSSIAYYDESESHISFIKTVQDNLQSYDVQAVKKQLFFTLNHVTFPITSSEYIMNFKKLPENVRKVFTSEYSKVVDILIRSAFKQSMTISEINDIIGEKNTAEWLVNHDSSIETIAYDFSVLNSIDPKYIFNSSDSIRNNLNGYRNMYGSLRDVYDYIKWFSEFNSILREKITKNFPDKLNHTTHSFYQINNKFTLQKVLSIVDDLLKKETHALSEIDSIVNSIVLDDSDTKKYFIGMSEQGKDIFVNSVLKGLLLIKPNHQLSSNMLYSMFPDCLFYSESGVLLRNSSGNDSKSMFITTSDFQKIFKHKIQLSNINSVSTFLKEIKDQMSNYTKEYSVGDDHIIPVAVNDQQFLFLLDNGFSVEDDMFLVRDDVVEHFSNDHPSFPIYVRSKDFLQKIGELPEYKPENVPSRQDALKQAEKAENNGLKPVLKDGGNMYVYFPPGFALKCGIQGGDLFEYKWGDYVPYSKRINYLDVTYIKLKLWEKMFGKYFHIDVEKIKENYDNCDKEMLPLKTIDGKLLSYIGTADSDEVKQITQYAQAASMSVYVYLPEQKMWTSISPDYNFSPPHNHVALHQFDFKKIVGSDYSEKEEYYHDPDNGIKNLFISKNIQKIIDNAKNQKKIIENTPKYSSNNLFPNAIWQTENGKRIVVLYKGFIFNGYLCLSDFLPNTNGDDICNFTPNGWQGYGSSCNDIFVGVPLDVWQELTGLNYEQIMQDVPEDEKYKLKSVDQHAKDYLLKIYNEGIPPDVINGKPQNTMFSQDSEKLVYIGKGTDLGLTKLLNITENDVFAFNKTRWSVGYSGTLFNAHYATRKELWEKITGTKVPDEYYNGGVNTKQNINNKNNNAKVPFPATKDPLDMVDHLQTVKEFNPYSYENEHYIYIGHGPTDSDMHGCITDILKGMLKETDSIPYIYKITYQGLPDTVAGCVQGVPYYVKATDWKPLISNLTMQVKI